MRKFFVLIILLLFVAPGVMAETLAEYYETTYWGELKTQERDGIEYVGREWKTHSIKPEKDFNFVVEDKANGDDSDVSLVWTSRDHETGFMGMALGICYSHNNNRYAFCGVLFFASEQNLKKYMDDFKGDGLNVADLIENVHFLMSAEFLAELSSQIKESANKVIGE